MRARPRRRGAGRWGHTLCWWYAAGGGFERHATRFIVGENAWRPARRRIRGIAWMGQHAEDLGERGDITHRLTTARDVQDAVGGGDGESGQTLSRRRTMGYGERTAGGRRRPYNVTAGARRACHAGRYHGHGNVRREGEGGVARNLRPPSQHKTWQFRRIHAAFVVRVLKDAIGT
ncbi:hypothetical protein B0H13DRAFT_2132776 [Mycena leptocephala]|nr:hypothetical protein B0H13DRAFT_2132776 [Mycena leptocephala]